MTGKHHLGKVAALPCALCEMLDQPQQGRTTVHHIRAGQGLSQRASDFLTVPLCHECHQGPNGVHGDQALLRIAKTGELDLLADTIRKLTQEGKA